MAPIIAGVTGRSPVRLLAPVALVAAAVALFAIVSAGGGDSTSEPSSSATEPEVTATATAKPEKQDAKPASSGDTYTVEPGDTPSGIAAKLDIDPDDLLAANPDVDATALTVGEELQLP